MNAMTKDVKVSKINVATATLERGSDVVTREAPLHVFVNGMYFVSFLCSPILLKELVVGHLLCEGLVDHLEDILAIDFGEEDRCLVTLRKTEREESVVLSKPFARLIVSTCSGAGRHSSCGVSGCCGRLRFGSGCQDGCDGGGFCERRQDYRLR